MAGKSATFENQLLQMIFWGNTIPNICQNAASPLTQLWLSLHTSDPSLSGSLQNAGEATYGGYARVALSRSSSAWNISGSSVSPVSTISFPVGLSGAGTATFAAIGVASSGATTFLYSGPISPTIVMGASVIPSLPTGSSIGES